MGVGMVGRAAEKEAVRSALDALDSGATGAVLAVTGEPGIGKTALLRYLAGEATSRGATVLAAAAAEGDVRPFAVVADALGDHAASAPHAVSRMEQWQREELAHLLPSFAAEAGARPAIPAERHRLYRSVAALLGAAAGAAPLAVVLDDLQWIDQAGAELLADVLRRPPTGPVLLACATRRAGLDARLAAALAAGAARPGGRWLDLQPLPRSEAERLLDAEGVPQRARPQLLRDCGGNPFYLLQLSRAPLSESGATAAAPADPDVPAPVAAALGAELDALNTDARSLVDAAAVLGDPVDTRLVTAVAGLEAAPAAVAAQAVVDSGLVVPDTPGGRWRFRHPIVARAARSAVPAARRVDLHRAALAELTRTGAGPLDRARHARVAAQPGDDEAIALLSAAAAANAARAPADAVGWWTDVLELLPDPADTRRLGPLLGQATALAACGRLSEAAAALDGLIDALPEAMTRERAKAVAARCEVDHQQARHAPARARLERWLERTTDPGARRPLELAMSSNALYRADFAIAYRWAAAAAASGEEDLATLGHLALAAYCDDRLDEAQAVADRAAAALDGAPDETVAGALTAAVRIGSAEVLLDRPGSAIAHLERALDVARVTGQGAVLIPALAAAATARMQAGHLPQASRHAQAAMEAAALAESPHPTAWACHAACAVALATGDLESAQAHGERALMQAETLDAVSALTGGHVAAVLVEAGHPERARDVLLRHAGGPQLPLLELADHPRWLALMAEAALLRGDVETASGWAERAAATARQFPLPSRTAAAARASAAVARAAGDHPDTEGLAAARDDAADAGLALEAALCDLRLGQTIEEPAAAIAALRAAESAFMAAGARRWRDTAGRSLRELGERSAVPAPSGGDAASDLFAALSTREREIVELVCRGRTNRAIAAELFLSERTVETHLTKAYAKLGVRSRTALMALAARG